MIYNAGKSVEVLQKMRNWVAAAAAAAGKELLRRKSD